MEALKVKITELDARIKALCAERSALQQQLAEMHTSIKVGDRVTFDGAKAVWLITAIRPGYGNEPKYYGSKIKKDGTPGANVGHIWQCPYGKQLFVANAAGKPPSGSA